MARLWVWASLAVALLATTGCGNGDGAERRSQRAWTFMVYLDGDNDLEEAGVWDVNEMERVGSTDAVSIVVQFDRGPQVNGAGDWSTARRFLIAPDRDLQSITSPLLMDLGEVDMASTQALRGFVSWATSEFPADHYALVLWNHGAGWRSRSPGTGAAGGSRGIHFDGTSGTAMTMDGLRAALSTLPARIDLVAIDASLMGMLEVCYEIHDQTDYIVASEESPPGTGNPYDVILSRLVADPEMTPADLGRVIVDAHVEAYPNYGVTQSLIETARLPELCARVDALAASIRSVLPSQEEAYFQALATSQAYAFAYYRDLFDFTRNARAAFSDDGVRQAADAVMQGIPGESGGPVLYERHNLPAVMNSHGLSIYLPRLGEFYGSYDSLRFNRDFPNWSRLLHDTAGSSAGRVKEQRAGHRSRSGSDTRAEGPL